MKEDQNHPHSAAGLRQRAEARLQKQPAHVSDIAPEEARRLLHERRVHQIELEVQNEELRRAQEALEASRAKYFDLYDLAPVGYVTLGETGLILDANLTAANLLGVDRGLLIKRLLARLIVQADKGIYYRHRKLLLETRSPQVCEVRMAGRDGAPVWVRIQAILAPDGEAEPLSSRATLSDVTERKQAEADRERLVAELQGALARIKTLTGLLPICCQCKKIRTGKGSWVPVDAYIMDHTDATLTHGICPDCRKSLYPGV